MSYRLKYLIDKLIMKAFLYQEPDPRFKTPGKLIKMLSNEERELLKEARSKDFYHHRV